jgi:hypothetical protein
MKGLPKLLAVIVLFTSSIACGGKPDEPRKEAIADALPTGKIEDSANVARPGLTFEIRHPWNRGDAVLVRLDIDRLRAHDLSKEDVMRAMTPSGLVGHKEPPPGVVFNAAVRPDQYEEVILKASPEGEIVRLKDVAKVELLAGRAAQEAEPNAAAEGGSK